MIKIGDAVKWRGAFGCDPEKDAIVESIEYCPNGGKYGIPRTQIPEILKDKCVFVLTNGHWAKGRQIN